MKPRLTAVLWAMVLLLFATTCGVDGPPSASPTTPPTTPRTPTSAPSTTTGTVPTTSVPTGTVPTTLAPELARYEGALADAVFTYYRELGTSLHREDAECVARIVVTDLGLSKLERMGSPAEVEASVSEDVYALFAQLGGTEGVAPCIGIAHLIEAAQTESAAASVDDGEEPPPPFVLTAASDQCLRTLWDGDARFRLEFMDVWTVGTAWEQQLEGCLTPDEAAVLFGEDLPSERPNPQPFAGDKSYLWDATDDSVVLSGGPVPSGGAPSCAGSERSRQELELADGSRAVVTGEVDPAAPWTNVEVRGPSGELRWQARLDGVAPYCLVQAGDQLVLAATGWREDTSINWGTIACAWAGSEECIRQSYYLQAFDLATGGRPWWVASLSDFTRLAADADSVALVAERSLTFEPEYEVHVLDAASGAERFGSALPGMDDLTIVDGDVYVTIGADVAGWDAVTGEPAATGRPQSTTTVATTTTLPRPWADDTSDPAEWWPGGQVIYIDGSDLWIASPRDGTTRPLIGVTRSSSWNYVSGSPDGGSVVFSEPGGPPESPVTTVGYAPTTVRGPVSSGAASIVAVGTDGTGRRQVTPTSPVNSDTAPSWSPDGKRIAFLRFVGGADRLHVVRPDGSGLRLVSDRAVEGRLTWTLDSAAVIVELADSDPMRPEYVTIDIATGVATAMRSPEVDYQWHTAWSPDGDHAVYITSGDRGDEVRLWSQAEGDLGALAVGQGGGWAAPSGPSWSPDGRWVIWEHGEDGLLVANIETREIHQLVYLQPMSTEFPVWISGPA